MKAILIVDLSKDVLIPTKDIDLDKCEIHYVIQDCYGNPIKAEVDGTKLKPMPRKKTTDDKKVVTEVAWWDYGYNACIDELIGEQE